MSGTPSPSSVSTKLQRIATLAQEAPERVLTTLAHHIDVAFLREAYRRTRKDGAVGVDGHTAHASSQALEANLASLPERFKSGSYYAPPVRRVYLPKEGGGAPRPIGIPSFEDKVLQRAVAMVLEAVYEQDFLDCSYGFRPRRSAHQALEALWQQVMRMGGGWVIMIDMQTYFDAIGHPHLRRILDKRVGTACCVVRSTHGARPGSWKREASGILTPGSRKAPGWGPCCRTWSCTRCWMCFARKVCHQEGMNGFSRPDPSHALPAYSAIEQFHITVQNLQPMTAGFACRDVGGSRQNSTEQLFCGI